MKLTRVLVLAAAALFTVVPGCSSEEPGVASEDLTEIGFEELDVSKFGAPAGLTVLKSTAAYVEFFGEEPPESVNFSRHWVVHVSAGVKNTGGYGIDILRLEKTGTGVNKTLVVHGHATSPGANCIVTQAITNPQVAVRINKQPGTPNSTLQLDSEILSCGNETCQELGGECHNSPTDVTFPANCMDDFVMEEVDAECPAINQACCVPISCGGLGNLPCPGDAECVDDPSDSCDPNHGGADCGGICAPKAACDASLICTQALTCVDGKMYPTGCGPANCDEPIGDC